jgi:2-oxo-4-hydroxy-4-carboxy-5-ureidoimidazoline decarboxylase
MPALEHLNTLSDAELRGALTRCCGAHRWVDGMMQHRPFLSEQHLYETADSVWNALSPEDWLEAFTHHPKIGDINSLREKFNNTKAWASGEQAGVQEASEETLQGLAKGNADYEEKFGYIFIVCATGKRADEMLAFLQERLHNAPEVELTIAAQEQAKITRIRLQKLMSEGVTV